VGDTLQDGSEERSASDGSDAGARAFQTESSIPASCPVTRRPAHEFIPPAPYERDDVTFWLGTLVVSIPSIGVPAGPTGQVFNGTPSFNLPDGKPALFLFDTLDGQILGWNGGAGTTAVTVSTIAGAVYIGLAIASSGGANYIYAADNTGHITVFDANFSNVTGTTFAGKFVDPNPVAGFHPFNIRTSRKISALGFAWLDPCCCDDGSAAICT
jgi:hypothetical protein